MNKRPISTAVAGVGAELAEARDFGKTIGNKIISIAICATTSAK
jgi:hypothetical protein